MNAWKWNRPLGRTTAGQFAETFFGARERKFADLEVSWTEDGESEPFQHLYLELHVSNFKAAQPCDFLKSETALSDLIPSSDTS
jgi:hypothetical protein